MITREHKVFLVIEDNADDAVLIRRAFKSLHACEAIITRNLSEAKAYLEGAGMYQDREQFPFPNGVLCNLHRGAESGMEFLGWIKNTEFKGMPVFVLIGVANPAAIKSARDAGALEVLVKPTRYQDLEGMLRDLASKLCS